MSNKILIIDDEADVATYLSMILKSNDFKSYTLDSVVNALDKVKKIQPDLICLDIMMPEETGISFYKKLRKSKEIGYIPVIIISGVVPTGKFDFQSFVKDKSIPPPERFMEKPIDIDDFISTINELIGRKPVSKN